MSGKAASKKQKAAGSTARKAGIAKSRKPDSTKANRCAATRTTTAATVTQAAPATSSARSVGAKSPSPVTVPSAARAKTQQAPTTTKTNRGSGKQTDAWASDVLARAEVEVASVIESLNKQMTSAMTAITELAVAQRGRSEAVLRTEPLDRATAMFQRLVTDAVDEHVARMLPTIIALRSEMAQRLAAGAAPGDAAEDDFLERGVEMLDQVLAGAQVNSFDARTGETFDPVIHLAVGETDRADIADGAVSELIQPGFRSVRGKVISPARVKVNRR